MTVTVAVPQEGAALGGPSTTRAERDPAVLKYDPDLMAPRVVGDYGEDDMLRMFSLPVVGKSGAAGYAQGRSPDGSSSSSSDEEKPRPIPSAQATQANLEDAHSFPPIVRGDGLLRRLIER